MKFCFPVILLALAFPSYTLALDKAEIASYLQKWNEENWTYNPEDFHHFNESDIPTLAEFLDHQHAHHAYEIMIALSYEQCLEEFLRALPDCYYQARSRICGYIVKRSREPGFPAERTRQIILNLLKVHRFQSELILGLGAVGTNEDISLIDQLFGEEIERIHKEYSDQFSRDSASDIANDAKRWACARLGDPKSLEEMALNMIPPDPNSPEAGNVTEWNKYSDEMSRIGYVLRPELLSALKPSILYTAEPKKFECFSFSNPSRFASLILRSLVPLEYRPEENMNSQEGIAKWLEIAETFGWRNP